jgi:enamine deaminase RidA (YjgF/YER057c/UK114 family)
MTLKRISSGSRFEELAAYSRAVVDSRYVHLSGTVGVDPVSKSIPDSVTEQMQNIFRIVEPILTTEGATLASVVRCRVFLTAVEHLEAVAAVLREKFANCRPANTTLICGIPAPGAKVEIEITALRGGQS